MSEGNLIARLVLYAWVPVCVLVYVLFARRWGPGKTTAVMMVVPVLLLPAGVAFDFTGLPPLDKHAIATIGVCLGLSLTCRHRLRGAKLGLLPIAILVITAVGAVSTVANNDHPLIVGPWFAPALRPYDALSMIGRDLLSFVVPFAIGHLVYRRAEDVHDLLLVVVKAGLLYSLLVLFEIRMSPQLHMKLYGFFPHEFLQTMRGGGFRATVFMLHGLAIALFLAGCVLSATTLRKTQSRMGLVPLTACVFYLFFVLVLDKSLAAALYAGCGTILIGFFGTRTQIRVASVLAMLVLAYPFIRTTEFFPEHEIVEWAQSLDAARAQSIEFRFAQESQLVDRAMEKVWSGWGGFGRSRIHDPETGRDISVTDGEWIIMLGTRGYVGMVAKFGLLLLPVLVVATKIRRVRERKTAVLIGGLSIIVSVHGVDAILNSIWDGMPYLFSGALYGVITHATARPARSFPPPAVRFPGAGIREPNHLRQPRSTWTT